MAISLETAQRYLHAKLSVLPAHRINKFPAIKSWKVYQQRLPTEAEVTAQFSNHHEAVCIIAGKVSGNLEIIDFDNGGELFERWSSIIEERVPNLMDRLVIENTPSGGWHVIYRCEGEVSGNMKLAQGQRNGKLTTLIETRGNGGLFLCAPTPGYELLQGDLAALPTLTEAERETLLQSAWELNEHWQSVNPPFPATTTTGTRPGDDYNERGDVKALLESHGWKHIHSANGNEYFRRPGKTDGSWSASLKDRVFYVFSSNAAPFEPSRAYSPFAVYAALEHKGDFAEAAKALLPQGYGESVPQSPVDISGILPQAAKVVTSAPPSLRELLQAHPKLRQPIIHGLLREGETMNIIAPTKTGKSWLVIDLSLAVATGLPWLGMPCESGNVLIIDNELHGETSANRIPKVAEARGIRLSLVYDKIFVENLRGRLMNICTLKDYFEQFKPGQFKVIILDAFYRFLPSGTDENDNGAMADIYNRIDYYADKLKCSFVLIHHTSKGNQSLKSVTDVGAGAGTQARATDTHLVLRHHEEPDVVAVDAAVRSWPPLEPYCLYWKFPVWNPARELDPKRLQGMKQEHDSPRMEPDVDEFIELFFGPESISKARLYDEAIKAGMSQRTIDRLLQIAMEEDLICRKVMPNQAPGFVKTLSNGDGPRSDQIRMEIEKSPEISIAELARKFNVTERWIRKIKEKIKEE